MSNDIERLLYYERQYLQSTDFTAEQTYHLEMRRRLNLALHLWGIVKGLQLLKGAVIQGAPDQYYLSEGMAIDAYGREIIVSQKHLLSDDLDTNRITGAGRYSVWIGYTRAKATPPQAGFQPCDMTNQYTRWVESFEITISSPSANPNPTEDPDPFGDLPDDPTKYPWLIHLGTITVDASQNITGATNAHRIYIGLRSQRIIAPHDATSEFDVLTANTPLKPLTSIAVRDNLFLEQNLIAGTDFKVDKTKIQPSPPSTFPNPTGNVKIASDVFLQGDLYTHCDPTQPDQWLSLETCIQSRAVNLVPDVQIGSVVVTFDQSGSSLPNVPAHGTATITTPLAQVDTSRLNYVTTSIANLTWTSTPPSSLPSNFEIDTSAGPLSLVSGTDNQYQTTITCTVTGIPTGGNFVSPLKSVSISWIIILYPQTS